MRYILLVATTYFLMITSASCDYFQGFSCGHELSDTEGLTQSSFLSISMADSTYQKENDRIMFGNTEFMIVDYLFKKNKFVGIAVPVCGKDNINEILRFFDSKHGTPIKSKKIRGYTWITKNEAILFKRFNRHLGQVNIYCVENFKNQFNLSRREGDTINKQIPERNAPQ